jgi:hypothetical protein
MTALAGCPGGNGTGNRSPEPQPRATVDDITAARQKPSVEATRRALDSAYATVVDVTEAGAGGNGQRSIDDVLRAESDDDTALFFPPGRYTMTETWQLDEFSKLALVGKGAVVRPPQGFDGTLFGFGTEDSASDLRFEGIDFDFSARNTGARPIHGTVADDLYVRDVAVRGRQDVDQDSVRFDVTDPDGTGRVERLSLPDGGDTEYANTGIYVGEATRGKLSFVDCHVAGFPDNGLYASPAQGPIRVIGGRYENNGIAGVRVSGGSRIQGVTVRCDSTRDGLENMRGIRLRSGEDIVVKDSTIQMRSVTESDGAITMAEWLESASIENTVIETNADNVPGITAKPPTSDLDGETAVALSHVTIRGAASEGSAVAVFERSGCEFEQLCIDQQGANRNGIQLADSQSNTLRRSTIAVTGQPLVLENATVDRRRVSLAREHGKCGTGRN